MSKVDFSPVAQAKIRPSQFARLCGASRFSAIKWIAGEYDPRGLYLERVLNVLKLIRRAVERGHLPLPENTPRKKQLELIVTALRSH